MCESDAKIAFVATQLGARQTLQLTFNNNKSECVSWRAFALDKVSLVQQRQQGDTRRRAATATTAACPASVFTLVPSSGVLVGLGQQTIQLEFWPRGHNEQCGEYAQTWQLDSRIASASTSAKCGNISEPLSPENPFKCKLFLSGIAHSPPQPIATGAAASANNKSVTNNTSTSSSSFTQMTLSSSMLSTSATTTSERPPVSFKEDLVVFADTPVGGESRATFEIWNRDQRAHVIRFLPIAKPFRCKYTSITIKARNKVKIEVSCHPDAVYEYKDRFKANVESLNLPIGVNFKCVCVPKT